VIDFDPTAPQADEYRKLAKAIDENEMFVIPKPLSTDDLESMLIRYGVGQ
jgi:nitrogenase iron protein NifH